MQWACILCCLSFNARSTPNAPASNSFRGSPNSKNESANWSAPVMHHTCGTWRNEKFDFRAGADPKARSQCPLSAPALPTSPPLGSLLRTPVSSKGFPDFREIGWRGDAQSTRTFLTRQRTAQAPPKHFSDFACPPFKFCLLTPQNTRNPLTAISSFTPHHK